MAALWLTAFAGPLALRADDDGPLFGGTPILEQEDEFGGGELDFLVTVYTAVYYGPDAVLPDALELVELGEGESYLIYLLHNHGETAVDLFGLMNPDSITIPAAGILPADIVHDEDFDPDDLVHPSVWFFGIDLISFAWDESFGLLGPGNWSIVFYRSKGWQDVTSWVGDSADGGLDFGLLPGPSEDVDLPEEPNNCPADVNGDGVVDALDLGAVTACLGQEVDEGDSCFPADVNSDGVVDALDIGFVIARFGECPVPDCDDSPDDCEDGIDCTGDVCEDGTCVYAPNDAACDDDELFCNGSEACDALAGCVSSGDPCDPGTFCNEATDICDECQVDTDCDDGVGCTNDACVEGLCVSTPDDGYCDNGLFCDGAETCDGVNDCQPGTAPVCDDAVGCTDDSCNEETDSCDYVANDGNCDNGLFCDGAETCDEVNDCRPGTAPDCDDADACTADSCESNSGCVHESIACDDEDACTNDGCDPDMGCTHDPVNCDDNHPCTLDSCDPATGCVSDPIDCNDGNPCTIDGCNPANGLCVNEPISSCCGNGVCEPGEDSCACPIDCGEPPPNETNCADGIDEDCDQLIDCDDFDCEFDPICICIVDGQCADGEDCVNCPEDCFAAGGTCGDGICEGDGEDCVTCTADCPCTPTPDTCWACCGDGVCSPVLETVTNCPVDCDPEFEPPTSCCGDGSCEGSEDAVNCAVDCVG